MRAASLIVALGLVGPTYVASAQPAVLERLLAVEDARDASSAGQKVFREALASGDASLRRRAVRAVGRLEEPELASLIVGRLADADAGVRQEAANALGQAATSPVGVSEAHDHLMRRLQAEQDPVTWGVVAATLGRLRYERSEHVIAVEGALRRVLPPPLPRGAVRPGTERDTYQLQRDATLGAVKGFESLTRLSRRLLPPLAATTDQLRATTRLDGGDLARVRRLAWQALVNVEGADAPLIEAGLTDPDGDVRRLAMLAAGGTAEIDGRDRLLLRGLSDTHAQVRYEALRGWGRHHQPDDCAPVLRAVGDADPHVALLAIDLLGNACAGTDAAVLRLRTLAGESGIGPGTWHRAAHALVSLARVAPDEARPLLTAASAHAVWQVRMYAARAAARLGAFDVLTALARDPHDNVKEAAIGELASTKRPEAAGLAIEALARPDYQLVRTAARALHDRAHRAEAVPALLGALARITADGRDTSRDPRMAILDALAELAWPDGAGLSSDQIDGLRPYLRDFDRRVAARAAELLQAWTKEPQASQPRTRATAALSLAQVDALTGLRARVTMAQRGTFELRFFVHEAPYTVHRVVSLARRGYYDGLTFHRVVPNFVIQGGSPGANEYAGDGPYMRDEVGLLSHRRGTLGISTRGRDTGDAQVFVNLVDTPRLDHNYTVFAEVVEGMAVVDAIVEGDVIERFEIVP
jgi:cyclophilin family peptidyl-prolyl cis-trans isomerase/HEAT repeat protein